MNEAEEKMAGEKQKKRKFGVIKQILKWIGLILLSLLIILGLIFQAPWKVITLLIIMFLACTALPKPYRKWFWLSVGAVVVALIIWVFLPEEDGNWKSYKYDFDKELTSIEAARAIPDEENAARIYNELLQDYDEDTFYTNLSDDEQLKLPMREPWLSKDHPKIAEWVKAHQNIIDRLNKASEIEYCQFSISEPNNFEKQMNRNVAMRHWAFLLVSAANNDIAEGHTKESLQKNFTLLQMGKHLCQQPSTIDWLVGIAIEAIAIGQFKTFAITGDAIEEYLSFIEQSLTGIKPNWNSDFLKILESDKLTTKREFARYYQINPKGKIRLSRDPLAEMRARLKQQLENGEFKDSQYRADLETFVYLSYWQRKRLKAQTILLWFYLPSSPKKAVDLIETIYQRYYEMTKPDFDWTKQLQEFLPTSQFKFRVNRHRTIESLAGISKRSYYQIHEIHFRHASGLQGSRIIIALRRYKNKYGQWPENIDQIKNLAPAEIFVDPINGNSFVYKLADDSFKIYSKGKNNIDEDGKRDIWNEETGADDWLIWEPKLRKTQEEKTDDEQQ